MRINSNNPLTMIHTDLQKAPTTTCNPEKRRVMLEKLMDSLDACEKDIKHRMQDRMKFMSGKNAFRSEAQLVEIDETRQRIRCELRSLEEKISC